MPRSKQLAAAVLLLSLAPNAFAYLDPGTGSMLIQGLVAAVAMASLTLKSYWQRFTGLFSSKQESDAEEDQPREGEAG